MPQSLKIDEPASKSQVKIETLHFKTFPSKLFSHFCHLSYLTMAYVTLSNIGLTPAKKKKQKKLSGLIFSNCSTRTRDDIKPVSAIKSY